MRPMIGEIWKSGQDYIVPHRQVCEEHDWLRAGLSALAPRRLPLGRNAPPFGGRVTTSTSTADIALPTRGRERAEVSCIDAKGFSG